MTEEERAYEEFMAGIKAKKAESELIIVPFREFLKDDILPPEPMMGSWLPCKGLAMVYAKTGVGKTLFCLSAALSIATGRDFLGWKVPARKRVLYLDGELPQDHLQKVGDRLCNGLGILDEEPISLYLMTIDRQPNGVPKITNPGDQRAITKYCQENAIDLIVVDNISTLSASEHSENDAASWDAVQSWALSMRAEGRTVLFVHHAGKSGNQRGTSRREDVLDSVIKLSAFDDEEQAGFQIDFDKHRRGPKPDPVIMYWQQDDEKLKPVLGEKAKSRRERVAEMWENQASVVDISVDLAISREAVYKHLRHLQDRGLLAREFKRRS